MTGWNVFIAGCVCAGGALLFLRVAAAEVQARRTRLDRLEENLRLRWQKRQAEREAASMDEPIVLKPLGKADPDA